MRPEPTIEEFISAGTKAIEGKKDNLADTRRGSTYEHPLGAAALLWSREAQADTDLFKATRFDTAEDDNLTDYVKEHFDIDRILDTYGQGQILVTRPTAAAGAGTFWQGTHIIVASSASEPIFYEVSVDTPVTAGALGAYVPIRATVFGPGVAISTNAAKFNDPNWDSTWQIISLNCVDGTLFEPASVFRARVRDELQTRRRGYVPEITIACQAAGAANVVCFPSYRSFPDSPDFGLNVCYVGDASFTTGSALIKACKLTLENFRVAGDNLQVLPMTPASVTVSVTVYLWDAPTRFNLIALDRIVRAAAMTYINGSTGGGFYYSRDALAGAIRNSAPAIQDVVVILPTVDATIMSGNPANFPDILSRYSLKINDISIDFQPPI